MIKIKRLIQNNKKIIENFSYLSLLQVFTLVMPLITYPYIIKVVGLELYGVVIFAQTIVSYFSLVINFGFDIIGPKYVALYKDDRDLLSKYVSSIYIIKLGLWFLCFITYLIMIRSIGFFNDNYTVYLYAFFITIGNVFFPIWFFQGIEKMKYITFINLFVKSLFIIAIFVFIKDRSDYILIPLLNSLGAFVSGGIAVLLIVRKERIVFQFVPIKLLRNQFKEGFTLFISTVSIQLYLNLNKLIIGRFLGMSEVTIYDLAQKVILILKLPIGIVSQAIFPKIAREKSISFINKMMVLVVTGIILIYGVLYFSSNEIVVFLMHRRIPMAVSIIRILGFSVIFVALNIFLGSNRLIPFGYNRYFVKATMYNVVFYFIFMGILFLSNNINIYTISYSYVSVEIFATLVLFLINKKLKLLI